MIIFPRYQGNKYFLHFDKSKDSILTIMHFDFDHIVVQFNIIELIFVVHFM